MSSTETSRPTVPAGAPRRTGPVGVGLIGAGMISEAYLKNLTTFPDLKVLIVGDLEPQRAATRAAEFGVPGSGTAADVLAHPDVELVVNLTIPAVHAEVSAAAIAAGKHVWSEKPIGIDRDSARGLLADAAAAGLLVGVAPDTVLGPGLQTARRAIERGDIGVPLSAQTVIQYPGPDLFHPNPEFLFAAGAGPLFDIGPYYLTALAHIFGPFATVAAVGSKSRATRTILVGDRAGTEFPVVAPSHVAAIASFAGGGVAQSVFSFDSPLARTGFFEVTGTEGTLVVPDPNTFGGSVRITRPATMATLRDEPAWVDVPVAEETYGRGAGALDLARCIRGGGAPVASGELGYHILDVMVAMEESIVTHRTVEVASAIDPVPLLPDAWDPHAATL
nr:Gfo/Idh/MocA family oxidoreductase [Propionicimonas sp.]